MLKYKINVLEALKENGINTTRLRREKLLSEGAIQRLRTDQPISWANIEQICKLLECQPSDFLIYDFN